MPGLDTVLGGGFPRGGMHFLVGAPGVGKTVLGLQTAFGSARAGQAVMFLTTLAESHDKLLAHASSLGYFDQDLVGNGLELINLQALIESSVEATVNGILAAIRRGRVSLVIVDGYAGLRGFFESEAASREFLYELGTKLGLLGITLLINIDGSPRDVALYPELTVADGVVALYYERQAGGHRRYVEVLKLRGANHLGGLHTLRIDSAGTRCFPQLESLPFDANPGFGSGRLPFGLPGLDEMLGGGLNEGTVTMLAGNPGTGKTLVSLQYLLAGAAKGEPGLLVGFDESEAQLVAKAAALGQDLDALRRVGLMHLHPISPVWLDADVVAQEMRAIVEEHGVRRLVVDPISTLMRSVAPVRSADYAAALVGYLRARGVTTLLTREVLTILGDAVEHSEQESVTLAENLIHLRQVQRGSEMHRVISILKMRFSDYDRRVRQFTVTDRGITVLDPLETTGGAGA